MSRPRAFPAPRNKLAVTVGEEPAAVTLPVGPGSSTLEVRVQGQLVMVSVVEAVTVKVLPLTMMTVGVGQTVTSVETTVVVVVTWQLLYLVHLGGGGWCVVLLTGDELLLEPLEELDDEVETEWELDDVGEWELDDDVVEWVLEDGVVEWELDDDVVEWELEDGVVEWELDDEVETEWELDDVVGTEWEDDVVLELVVEL